MTKLRKIEPIENRPFDHLNPDEVYDQIIEIKHTMNDLIEAINNLSIKK